MDTIRYIYISALVILLSASQIHAKSADGGTSKNQIALRAAIEDLITTFGPRYPKGNEYLTRLDTIKRRLKQAQKSDISEIKADFTNLQRQAMLDNPLVSGRPILYVLRPQYKSDHHNTATMFQTGEINTNSFQGGGALKTVDFAKSGKVTTLIESSKGLIRDPEVHFNGEKIIFSMRKDIKDDYHIYEINADGTGLKQLTSAPGVADFDPLYMPDDTIIFSSTREPKYCMCNRHIMGNLFRMDADGANIHQIAKSTLHEGHSALMPDGRIIYDFMTAGSTWTATSVMHRPCGL
ncbi:MAG: TolB family protein [Planctomycetota bacterium]